MGNKSSDLDLFNEVSKKIGVNILLFQQIERILKFLLPFMYAPNSDEKKDVRKYREKVKSQTLGNLINSFIESVDYDPDYFSEYLKKIVEERNKLVHHFGGSKGLNILNTEEGCRACIADLEAQRKEAFSFYRDLQLYTLSLLWFLREDYGESNPELDSLYKKLKTTVIGEVSYINLCDPSDTVWENTQIVKLLRIAELRTDKVGDMTLLARAGKFIKNQAPECTPKSYGIKTLKGVLKASNLFEIKSQDGSILYKSKLPH